VKLRVFNSTQAKVIVPDVIQIDTARDPFNVVARNLRDVANGGLWLNPFRDIPQISRFPEVDIVFIDEHHRVGRFIESYDPSTGMGENQETSVLVLPAGAVKDASIQPGDQLKFSDAVTGLPWAEEVVGMEADEIWADQNAGTTEFPRHGNSASPARARSAASNWSPDAQVRSKGSLKSALARLFGIKEPSSDRRKGERQVIPGLVAYFWTGASPKPSQVGNISTEGFYLLTEERWLPGTRILVSLQIVDSASHNVEAMISVPSKVVWIGSDGIGFAFDSELSDENRGFTVANPEELVHVQRFLQRIRSAADPRS
jgi:hypothetical protein